jgi:hypothetical protein
VASDEGVKAALASAVSAIYFTDSSDYLRALWEVVKQLDPEIYELLRRDPGEAWKRTHPDLASEE